MPIFVSVNVQLTEPGLTEDFSATQESSIAAAGYKVATPTIGTASTQISTATIGTLGYTFLRSLVTGTQSTSTITFGKLDGTALIPIVRLRPGDPAVLRLAPGNYAAEAAAEGFQLLVATFEE
jgi:hypothetical protein